MVSKVFVHLPPLILPQNHKLLFNPIIYRVFLKSCNLSLGGENSYISFERLC